ncbi:hypothetical protein PISMIDRAFT_680954 [Pisolithus microcarpus 441]|uniref:Uncharacterized protein n=1 Tax=Pisolithus microcarpus 441 TaxID=765257 RepID=A0A0C9YAQ3_9AGAM|nr:hypothetical protein PISMIDRAFT_680954 [Pisolithus microcarpus 441]
MPYLSDACSHSTNNANGIQEQLEGRNISATRIRRVVDMSYDIPEELGEPDERCRLFR